MRPLTLHILHNYIIFINCKLYYFTEYLYAVFSIDFEIEIRNPEKLLHKFKLENKIKQLFLRLAKYYMNIRFVILLVDLFLRKFVFIKSTSLLTVNWLVGLGV